MSREPTVPNPDLEAAREDCCAGWPKPCTYHEGWADGVAELEGENERLRGELQEFVNYMFTPPEGAVLVGDTLYTDQDAANAAKLMEALNVIYERFRAERRGLDALTIVAARDAVEELALMRRD